MPHRSNSLGPLSAYVASGIAPRAWPIESSQKVYAPDELWGQRAGSSTKGSTKGSRRGSRKGSGWFGSFSIANDNSMALEVSVGVDIDGKQVGVPSINPFQSREQIMRLLQNVNASSDPDILQNTIDWGYYRSSRGLSPFIQKGEKTVDFENHDPTYWRLRSMGISWP